MNDYSPEFVDNAKENIQYSFNLDKDESGNVVIGENHFNSNGLTEQENEEQTKLLEENKDSIFVVETDMSQQAQYNQLGVENTFMDRTIKYAKEKGKPLENMDEELINAENSTRYLLWEKIGTTISEDDYHYTMAIYQILQAGYSNPDSIPPFAQIYANILSNEAIPDTQKIPYLEGLKTIMFATKSGDLSKITEVAKTFIKNDGRIREIYYQEKIAKIKQENPEKKLFVVCGNAHREAISKTIKDTNYRSPLNEAKLQWQITELREQLNTPSNNGNLG